MSRIWLREPLAVHSPEDCHNGLVVENGVIVETLSAHQQPSHACETVFDASEHIILPGLVNCHHHFFQTLTRAVPSALNKELFPWLETLYPIWAKMTPDMVEVSTRLACAELMLSGCTLASDHHYLFSNAIDDAIDIQASVVRDLGIRALLTRGSMSLGQDQGGLPPNQVVQSEQHILKECERLVDTYHESHDSALIKIALAPCSPFSVSTDLMRSSAELAAEKDLRLHTHLAETLDEEQFCLDRFGLRTVDYLESVNWLHSNTWLAHGIHFNDDEISRLGKAGVGISHCPSSNMILGSGICRVNELAQAGCGIGIGVDGSASNDSSNLIMEVRQALLLQRLRYGSSEVHHQHALNWATEGGAHILGWQEAGTISVGKLADLALFKRDELRFSGSHDPLAALLLCAADRVDALMINGDWKVLKGQLLGVDLDQLRAHHSDAANALLSSV